MAKGSGGPSWSFGAFFAFWASTESEATVKKSCKTAKATARATTKARAASKKPVIASRKSCSATGTGLSHYILTDRKAK